MTVETRYKRSDQQTVNGLSAYILGTAQSASVLSVGNDGASVAIEATLRPTSDALAGFPTVYPSTPTTHYDKVDDATADDDSTYVETGDSTTEVYDRYDKPSFTLPAGKKIALIRVVCRGYSDLGLASLRFGVYVGTAYYMSLYYKPADWTTYTIDWAKNPATGLPWTQDDINSLQIAISGKSYYYARWSEWCYALVTQVYLEVYTYTDTEIYYAVDVVKRESAGTETVLGSKVAQWSGTLSGLHGSPGLKSATYSISTAALVSTDAVVVRVYQKVGAGAWNLVREWTTEQLGAQSLVSAVWTVYYYLDIAVSTTMVSTVYSHGTADYNSRIENFTWALVPPPVVKKSIGDGLTFVLV